MSIKKINCLIAYCKPRCRKINCLTANHCSSLFEPQGVFEVEVKDLPVAIKLVGGLSPERMIFIDGGVRVNAKWFDISLQCGPSLKEEDNIAFRVILSFYKKYAAYTVNSFMYGTWDDGAARKRELVIKGLLKKTNIKVEPPAQTLDMNSVQCALGTSKNWLINSFSGSLPSRSQLKDSKSRDDIFTVYSKMSDISIRSADLPRPAKFVSRKITRQKSSPNLTIASKSREKINFERNKKETHSFHKGQFPNKSNSENTLVNTTQSKELLRNDSFISLKISPKSMQHRGIEKDEITPQQKSLETMSPGKLQEDSTLKILEKELFNLSERISLTEQESSLTIPTDLIVIYKRTYDPNLRPVESERTFVHNNKMIENLEVPPSGEVYSDAELNEVELRRAKPFCIALECLENGYLMFLNGDLYCVYPHHFDYSLVTYIVFNGDVDLEQVEIGGGNGPDRTLVVDLYNEVVWPEHVVVLTDDNFNELVLASEEMWIVDAYTAWCPACQKLQPAWEAAANALQGKVNVSACDCDRNEQLVDDLDVKYYPMIFCYPKGKKDINSYQIYQGHYIEMQIVIWALDILQGVKQKIVPLSDKPIPRTLCKKKKPLLERKGHVVRGYGYVLRNMDESFEFHETSSSKSIYVSISTQTKGRLASSNKGEAKSALNPSNKNCY